MRVRGVWAALLALIVCLVAAVAAACGSNGPGENGFTPGGNPDGGDYGDPDGTIFGDPDGNVDTRVLEISPLDQVVAVVTGQPTPTVQYVAKLDGQQVPAVFTIDRGEIGSIGAQTGLFSPGGSVGGKAFVTATLAGKTAKTSVTVTIKVIQNGDPSAGDAGGGAGGNGGVGGEGPGGAVSGPVQTVLLGTPVADPGLAFLYPYDKTVWPRGILAPLLQWQPGAQSYDAVYIHIKENAYEFQGFFAKTATPFIHHPVPQAVWKQLAYSNAGEDVAVTLVFAAGGTAYGPVSETWKIAQGTLKGTVYYNSYGTALAQNYCCHLGTGIQFGGATLAIKGGSTDPVLVAGGNGNDAQCRVCHSVAAQGATLVTQHGDSYATSSSYDLKNGNAQTAMAPGDGRFAWPALFPDGTFMFSNSSPLFAGSTLPSALYAVPSGAAIASTGLPAGLRAGAPAFSPDGNHVAFNFYGGAGSDQKSLAVMDFSNGTKTFANFANIHTPANGYTAIWPSFLPTNDGVVFQVETRYNGRDFGGTRSDCDGTGACNGVGTRGELWWIDLKTKTAHRLDNLNGVGLPQGPNAHDADATLNYEPTVNPVPSGGYAWVVFTSRRLYGNVATVNPFWSDPRFQNIRTTPTTKKLWVAAIDLNATGGSDPSHPAFYLPAQELLAGNSRGYWVVDPCKQNGNACETGDECCGGFCRPDGDGGLTCTAQTPGCAQEFEKCTTNADCCNGPTFQCINGRCAQSIPR